MKTTSAVGEPSAPARTLAADVLAGFLVFLIALPLCLAISLASGYPAIAGVFTAIIGGLVTPWISNSRLTIKGPAAGLIVIAAGCIGELTEIYGADRAYALALGIGVAAGVLQILFALFRTGVLGDFFPTSTVHGMLAAIGVTIIAKQIPVMMGVMDNRGGALELLAKIPSQVASLNPEIAFIGGVSLLLLFGLPLIKNRWVRKLPAQLVVVLVAIPLGMWFQLGQEHSYTLAGQVYEMGPRYLVEVPSNLFGAITFPVFDALRSTVGWKWAIMFALIGTLESMLSAKAVDMLDPQRRKTNLDRDNLAVGVGNTLAASIGGLPMISEIVRSKANIDNGAQSKYANLFHGVFLLLFVMLAPQLIHRIPLAALAAMLVYTGFRLASPREFVHMYRVGREQLIIFCATLIAVLATDLLIGIAVGIIVKLVIHMINGVSIGSIFRPTVDVEEQADGTYVRVRQSVVFSNWILFRQQIEKLGMSGEGDITLDFSEASVVDHSVMEKLHGLEADFLQFPRKLKIVGLGSHVAYSDHPMSARRRQLATMNRVTIFAPPEWAERLQELIVECGASGFTSVACCGVGRSELQIGTAPVSTVRIETLVPSEIAQRLLNQTQQRLGVDAPITACIETVQVLKAGDFEVVTEAEPNAVNASSVGRNTHSHS